MASAQFELQPAHGALPLLIVLLTFVNLWAGVMVGKARRLYDVPYPTMYAEKDNKNAKAFNCVQRAHQNVLENIPIFLVLLFTSGFYRPELAAIAGVVRILGFIAYIRGYSTGDPQKRMQGGFGYLGLLASLVLTIETSLRIMGVL